MLCYTTTVGKSPSTRASGDFLVGAGVLCFPATDSGAEASKRVACRLKTKRECVCARGSSDQSATNVDGAAVLIQSVIGRA